MMSRKPCSSGLRPEIAPRTTPIRLRRAPAIRVKPRLIDPDAFRDVQTEDRMLLGARDLNQWIDNELPGVVPTETASTRKIIGTIF